MQSGIAQQAFLAKIMASKVDIDPERKKQLLEAVEVLDGISKQLGPTLQHAKSNPNDAASQKKAHAALEGYDNKKIYRNIINKQYQYVK